MIVGGEADETCDRYHPPDGFSYVTTTTRKYNVNAHDWLSADIRSRCAIHSAESGTIMVIPREDGLVRIYCQLSTVAPGDDGRFDRSRITPESILEAAQRIIKPYKLDYKYRDWWTVYQVSLNEQPYEADRALRLLIETGLSRLASE